MDEIFMDEPFSAVDEKERKLLQHYLLTAKEFKEKTILFITHHVNQEELSEFDKIVHVENGMVRMEDASRY